MGRFLSATFQLAFLLILQAGCIAGSKHAPRGVHLSLGSNDDEMVVTWQTHGPTEYSTVEYGQAGEGAAVSLRANGTQRAFVDGGPGKTERFIHVVVLTGLEPGAKYEYRVGSLDTWSEMFFFFAKRSPAQIAAGPPVRMIAWCDVGVEESDQILALIKAEVHGDSSSSPSTSVPDVLLQCGDFAYDLDADDGRRGDLFLDRMQAVAAHVPYMVSPGNHEEAFNFSHYGARFNMPGQGEASDNAYYSFDLGPVHVVAYNTEAFFWPDRFDTQYMARMYNWLEEDLRKANENRADVPWIMVHAHRPFYCVETTHAKQQRDEQRQQRGGFMTKWPKKLRLFGDAFQEALGKVKELGKTEGDADESVGRCEWEREASRKGLPSKCAAQYGMQCALHTEALLEIEEREEEAERGAQIAFPVEDLFYKYGVDLAFFGHEHAYERYYPVYNEVVQRGPGITFDRYYQPAATVHVVTGAGGNKNMDLGKKAVNRGQCNDSAPWCAYVSGYDTKNGHVSDFSFGKVTIYNATTLLWEQTSTHEGGETIDTFVIEAPTHGPFGNLDAGKGVETA